MAHADTRGIRHAEPPCQLSQGLAMIGCILLQLSQRGYSSPAGTPHWCEKRQWVLRAGPTLQQALYNACTGWWERRTCMVIWRLLSVCLMLVMVAVVCTWPETWCPPISSPMRADLHAEIWHMLG